MTQDGYRLFVVSLHDGRMQTEQLFETAQARKDEGDDSTPAPVNYLDVVTAYVSDHLDETSNVGLPALVDGEEVTEARGSSTRLRDSARLTHGIRMWFTSGPINADGISADPTGQTADVSLRGRSTLHDYRATLLTKPGGTRGILAVETRGRSCPYRPLTRALRAWSPVPWNLKIHENVADSAAVQNFINQGEIEHVDLTEWTFDADGGRIAKQHVLSARVDEKGRVATAKTYLRRWVNLGRETSPEKVGEEAKAAKGSFFSMKVDIPFNDVAITVRNGSQQRTLKPSTDYRRFTYYLADSLVDDDEFFSAAEMTAAELISNVQIVLEEE